MTAPSIGSATPRRKVHSRYADGLLVYKGQQPRRIMGPELAALGYPHSVIRWDHVHQRVYQSREFDPNGNRVRDIDFTVPTYPDGRPRPGHPGPPHQHRWVPLDPNNLRAGWRRESPEPIP